MVIGIEGYVASGKTSICHELLKTISNSILIDGSNLYRGLIYAILKQGLSISQLKERLKGVDVKALMDQLQVHFEIENQETVIYQADKKISEEDLHSNESSTGVSAAIQVANNVMLFAFAHNIIADFAKDYTVIVTGRGLMQIYPQMDYHILITSSLESRIERRYQEFHERISKEEIKQNILLRDRMHEESGFHKQYDKTITVDVTECKTIQESTKKVLDRIGKTEKLC